MTKYEALALLKGREIDNREWNCLRGRDARHVVQVFPLMLL